MKKIIKKKTIYFQIVIFHILCTILMEVLASILYNAFTAVSNFYFLCQNNPLAWGIELFLAGYIIPYYFVSFSFKRISGEEMPDLKDCLKTYAAFLKVRCFVIFCFFAFVSLEALTESQLSLRYILFVVIGIIYFLTTFIRFMQNKIKENKKNQLELFADVMETEEHNE